MREFNKKVGGLVTLQSAYGPKETMDLVLDEIKATGMRIFSRIDHSALAVESGLELQPTEVVIFGNPRGGTPLMQASQTMGIDLPLKILVCQEACGKTWLSYNDPLWLAKRHGVKGVEHLAGVMSLALSAIAVKATKAT